MQKRLLIKKVAALLLCLALTLSLGACGKETREESDASLSMFIGLGATNCGYYEKLHELILEKTGIDLKFVYIATLDVSSKIKDMAENNDLPADIVVSAALTPFDTAKNAYLDLAAYTNVPDLFKITMVQEVADEGKVYQLPFASRLIGIEYNKTLFEEQGWEVPASFDDMVALKEKAEAAGYKFAVSGGVATGHGFNYLLYIPGSSYLASADGKVWISRFLQGQADISGFNDAAAYFEKYVDAGLFGHYHDADWNAKYEFMKERALFYYNITNDTTSYDGFRYTEDGKIYGATYTAEGAVVAEEDENGELVFLDGNYVLYDPENENHAGLTRYTIPGAQILHDEYASMPWISEDGNDNSFVYYNNLYIGLDKSLIDEGNEEKLEKAIKVLEFMASEDAISLYMDIFPDGYSSSTNFSIDETRMYAKYKDKINTGYIVPWWYEKFDTSTIVNVGEKVNAFIAGTNEDACIEDILSEFELRNKQNIKDTTEYIAECTTELDFEDVARLEAVSAAMAVQDVLDNAGAEESVEVALMPYIQEYSDIGSETSIAVVQTKIYKGHMETATLSMNINQKTNKVVAIKMTGAKIEELVNTGYDSVPDTGDGKVFPYAMVVKGGVTLEADKEYVVAVPPNSLTNENYNKFLAEGKILTDTNGKVYTGNTLSGLTSYLTGHGNISPDNLEWK